MPAFVKSSVGSSSGTTLDDGTAVWPCFSTKKSTNCRRMSLAVSMQPRFEESQDANNRGIAEVLATVSLDPRHDNHYQNVDAQEPRERNRNEAAEAACRKREDPQDDEIAQHIELEIERFLAVVVYKLRLVFL